MEKEPSLGEVVFGENYNERIGNLYFNSSTQEEALEVLNTIGHYEMREVLDSLKEQMREGAESPKYSPSGNRRFSYLRGDKENILFTDWSYYKGFLSSFFDLLEKAYPEYSLPEGQSVGEIRMQKNR